jgi:alkaline phosphatase D
MKYFLLLTLLLAGCAKSPKYTIKKNMEPNSREAQKAPYVLLISIDGYRWDYTKKYRPKFLSKFKKMGSSVKSLRPAYPTKTFPNHLSIVTGRYPMNHGIVANSFYAPDLKKEYSLRNREAVENGDFYLSLPIWGLAERQGMRTATYFWPGSEAEILGERPSYFLKYNHGTPHNERIETVEKWFNLKDPKRPHLVTLYFHDVDSAGHNYGPDSKEVKEAIEKVDKSIEDVVTRVRKTGLPVNIIIVSDHGMASLKDKNYESILKTQQAKDQISNFIVKGKGPVIQLYNKEESAISLKSYTKLLNKKAKNYKCYLGNKTPKKYNFRNHPRVGDIVCMAKKYWSIGTKDISIPEGNHGWSQFDGKDMHAIFYAQGPSFKSSKEIGTRDNIHIYPLLAKVLGLKLDVKIDGKLKAMKGLLK